MPDNHFMQMALDLAAKGKGHTSPNPMVGAVIVRKNRVIATGWHKRCGADHAEIVALKKAGARSRGAKLYVTLEPCFHYGRTPPCVDKVIASGIREVVIGMVDPNPLTRGKSIMKLRRAGVKVKVGILRREAGRLNEIFIKYMRSRMPFVAAKCAQTLDGKIATAAGESQWITSSKTRDYARRIRDEFDAICAGVNTVLRDDPRLNGARKTKRLKKIVLDSSLKTPLTARLFKGVRSADCIIAVTRKASPAKIKQFQNKGVRVIICPAKDGRVDLKWLLKALAKEEITSILMEGGARVIGSALKDKLVDKLYIYVAPKIIGDQDALSSIVGVDTVNIGRPIRIKDLTSRNIGQDILLTGYV
ncbi:MAG: bifunctional diaminohydroxyphosphoribosylaminopyrimidine deaminase/5-amino-6-(5-phosphoribosylamino)uracil reductase RibD [Candidatus Omnitrophica bacterium]|nr:bifunctional diaminohydroxyphosphoribosylaminopyrimidine deaminase/5-amino-6-(5-phosphoribosylamino)uracil reductase RibD [Candidatus Omnitrophota bacterium]